MVSLRHPAAKAEANVENEMLQAVSSQAGEVQGTAKAARAERAMLGARLVSWFAAGLLLTSAACKSAPASETPPAEAKSPAEVKPVAKIEAAPAAAELAKASAETDAYSVALKAPNAVKAGVASNLELVVTPKAPFHCNLEYPYKLKLDANPALGLSGDPFTKDAFQIAADCTKLLVPFTAAKAGSHTVTGLLSFSVCKDDQCLVERQALSVAVVAE